MQHADANTKHARELMTACCVAAAKERSTTSITMVHLSEPADALVRAAAAGVADVLPRRVRRYQPVLAQRLKQLTLRECKANILAFSFLVVTPEQMAMVPFVIAHRTNCVMARTSTVCSVFACDASPL